MATLAFNKDLNFLLKGYVSSDLIPSVAINELVLDSRALQAGDVFFAVQGYQAHGLDYLQNVVKAKPALIIYEPSKKYSKVQVDGIPCLAIKDLHKKVSEIAARYYGKPSEQMQVTAITGTNGKTTSAYLIAQLLQSQGVNVAIIGTTGSGRLDELKKSTLTTPDAISLQKRLYELKLSGIDHVVMEASSHALHQYRLSAVQVDVAAFTNLSQDHLDYHKDMASYLEAKAMLFGFKSLSTVVLNADEQSISTLRKNINDSVNEISYSSVANGKADITAQITEYDALKTVIHLTSLNSQYEFSSKLLGQFNVANLLLALSVLTAFDFLLSDLVGPVSQLVPPSGRLERLGDLNTPTVVVDYAHTPDALAKALGTLKPLCKNDLSAVFGCGGDRDKSKRAVMGAIAQQYAKHIYLTDDNPRTESSSDIINEIKSGMKDNLNVHVIPNRAEAIRASIDEANQNDIILIAGKGHEDYQIIGTEKIAFSDQMHAQSALRKWQEVRS